LAQAPLISFVIMHHEFGFLNIKCNGYGSKGGVQNYQGHIFYVIIVMCWFFFCSIRSWGCHKCMYLLSFVLNIDLIHLIWVLFCDCVWDQQCCSFIYYYYYYYVVVVKVLHIKFILRHDEILVSTRRLYSKIYIAYLELNYFKKNLKIESKKKWLKCLAP
jgi:hypothetical protein